jgi:RNA polymerase sigma factor (sigma-70 family)
LSGYLFASVRYGIIHYINSSRLREDYCRDFTLFIQSHNDNSNEEKVALHQLEEAIEISIRALPKRCQEIFMMSRYQNLSIKEIAEKLNISHKTVENHLTIALKHLRNSLGDFLLVPLFIYLMLWN